MNQFGLFLFYISDKTFTKKQKKTKRTTNLNYALCSISTIKKIFIWFIRFWILINISYHKMFVCSMLKYWIYYTICSYLCNSSRCQKVHILLHIYTCILDHCFPSHVSKHICAHKCSQNKDLQLNISLYKLDRCYIITHRGYVLYTLS